MSEVRTQPSVVTEDQAPAYLDLMEAALTIDPDLPRSVLRRMTSPRSELQDRLGSAILQLSYVFANEREVLTFFPGLRADLPAWVEDETLPFQQRLTAMATLTGLPDARLGSEQLQRFGRAVAEKRGCAAARSYLSTDGSASGPCSLILTLQARAVPSSQGTP